MKRLIALILTATFISSLLCIGASASGSYDTVCGEALRSFGFVASSDPSDNISRGEFTDILVKMINGTSLADESVVFDDAPPSHQYYGSLTAAYKIGILSSTTVRPDDTVGYNEAVKMTVVALGYNDYAAVRGGWPAGYLTVANELKLLKNSAASDDGTINRANAYTLLYNALDAPVLDIVSLGSTIRYSASDKTLLLTYHGIAKAEGRLESVFGLSITDTVKDDKNTVVIDGKTYKYTDAWTLEELVGQITEYYYDTDTLKLCFIHSGENKVVTLNANDIYEVTPAGISYYDENDKECRASFSSSARIVYNGAPVARFEKNDFLSAGALINLIDNGADSGFDVAIIKAYTDYVISDIDGGASVIYDLYDSEKTLSLNRDDYEIFSFVNEFDTEMYVSELLKRDVISVLKSKDNNILKAYYVNKEIIGSIDAVEANGGMHYVEINGEKLGATSSFVTNEDVSPGLSGIFVLNKNGEVATVKKLGSDGEHYGFLIGWKKESSFSSRYMLKLLNDDTGIVTAQTAKNMEFDGQKLTDSDTPPFVQGPVYFKTNGSGEVYFFDTLNKSSYEDDNTLSSYYLCNFNTNGDVLTTPATLEYRNVGIFGGKIPVDSETRVLIAPLYPDSADDEDYRVSSMNYFASGQQYSVDLYKRDSESHFADVVFIRPRSAGAGATVPVDIPISVVDSVTNVISEDGEAYTRVYMYTKETYEYLDIPQKVSTQLMSLFDTQKVHTLACGDIIKYVKDDKDCISAIELIYERANDKFAYSSNTNASNMAYIFRVAKGEVYSIDSGNIMVSLGSVPSDLSSMTLESHNARAYTKYIYDSSETKQPLRRASVSDLVSFKTTGKGSDIILYSRYGNTGGVMVIYR